MARTLRRRTRSRSRSRKHKRKSNRRKRTRRSRGGTPPLDACGSTPLTRAIAAGPGAADTYPGWDATLDVQKKKMGATVDGMTNKVVVFTPNTGGSTIAWCHKSAASRLFSTLRTPRGETKFVNLDDTVVSLQSSSGDKATFLVSQLACRSGSNEWELTTATGTPLYAFLDQMTKKKGCGRKFDGVEAGIEM